MKKDADYIEKIQYACTGPLRPDRTQAQKGHKKMPPYVCNGYGQERTAD